MKIISWNVNGIRACIKKNFFDYVKKESPDIICLQEIKAQEKDIENELAKLTGYNIYLHPAERKGYSGVATFSKIKPKQVIKTIDIEKFDIEGRILITEFDKFILFNIYFPNGGRDLARLDYKLDFYRDLFLYCNDLKEKNKNIIICGDFNIAHKEIDLANPKSNEKNTGFLPVERAWIDKIIDFGYVDIFREFNKKPENYTWWAYWHNARAKNIGWRIDYFFCNKSFMKNIKDCYIQPKVMGSDHCPIVLEKLQ